MARTGLWDPSLWGQHQESMDSQERIPYPRNCHWHFQERYDLLLLLGPANTGAPRGLAEGRGWNRPRSRSRIIFPWADCRSQSKAPKSIEWLLSNHGISQACASTRTVTASTLK